MSLEPIVNSVLNYIPEAEVGQVCFDAQGSGFDADAILSGMEAMNPDLVLYAGPANGPFMPDAKAVRRIRDKKPLVNIICDGGDAGSHAGIAAFQKAESFSFHVNIDGMHTWPYQKNDITTLCPIDQTAYDSEIRKDISLGFYGGDGHKDRRDILQALGSACVRGTRNEKYGSYRAYADFLKRCTFTLNHAANGSNTGMHCKARTLEAGLAYSVLLEPKGSPIRYYFQPGRDYLEWETAHDILQHVTLLSTSEIHAMRESLRERVIQYYSADKFWSLVFDHLAHVEGLSRWL